jgi:hypothetical protein
MVFLFGAVCSLVVPISYIGVHYVLGRRLIESPEIEILTLAVLALGIPSTLAFWLLLWNRRVQYGGPKTWALVTLVFTTYYVVTFFGFRASRELWWRGATSQIDDAIGLDKLQAWGEEVVAKDDRGELKLDGLCEYIGHHAPRIAVDEIPRAIASARWGGWGRPQIGIHGAGLTNGKHVELSWHGHQILLGRDDLSFVSVPNTLTYLRVLKPGVIVACWDVR